MAIKIIDLFVCLVQFYMLTNLMQKLFRMKFENYMLRNAISMLVLTMGYFIINYGTDEYFQRMVISFIWYSIYGCIMFEGSWRYKISAGLIGDGLYLGLDLLCMILFSEWTMITVADMQISAKITLGRNLYNVTGYLAVVVIEFFQKRKVNKRLRKKLILTILLAVCQIAILHQLFVTDAKGVLSHIVIFSILFSGIVAFGYFITMEMFYQLVEQEDKKHELDKKQKQREFQYNYYLLAYEQGERIRNLRHDLRNQLQTMQHLLSTGGKEGKERAQGMLMKLEKELER